MPVNEEVQFPENELDSEDRSYPIYSFMQIMKQHEVRYYLNLSDGTQIVLKHLPISEQRRIMAMAALLYPEYLSQLEKYTVLTEQLREIKEGQENLAVELFKEATMAILAIRPVAELMAIGIVDRPHLWSKDSVDAFFNGMNDKDRNAVYKALEDLATVMPIGYVDFDQFYYAQRFGLQILEKDMIKDMTITQAAVLSEIIRQEKIAYEKELAQMRVRK